MTISDNPFFPRLRIILVQTSHPGNIGAAARAMKTMGLSELYLVDPSRYPSAEAIVRASGADDVLARARCVESLAQALEGCSWAFGTTARSRSMQWDPLSPRQALEKTQQHLQHEQGDVAVVFGRESSGLTNEELACCQQALHIPANPDYSSLNLGSAVQIVAYEARQAFLATQATSGTAAPAQSVDQIAGASVETEHDPLASHEQLEGLYQHLLDTMAATQFYQPERPGKLEARLRALFGRSAIRRSELQILRGFCAAVDAAQAPKSPAETTPDSPSRSL